MQIAYILVLGLWGPRGERKKKKKKFGWGNRGYMGIRGDTGWEFDPIDSVVYRDSILMIGTLPSLRRTVA